MKGYIQHIKYNLFTHMGTRQSVQMTFCQITLEHTVISQHYIWQIPSISPNRSSQNSLATQKNYELVPRNSSPSLGNRIWMWYCFEVISWRINKVCRNWLLVECYLSLNMNLTALFISTSTSWHVTLTNKNITSTKIILGNEPIGIVTKHYFYIKES